MVVNTLETLKCEAVSVMERLWRRFLENSRPCLCLGLHSNVEHSECKTVTDIALRICKDTIHVHETCTQWNIEEGVKH